MRCPACGRANESSAQACRGCGRDLRWWLYDAAGKVYGPYTVTELRAYAGLGHVSPWATLQSAYGEVTTPAQMGIASGLGPSGDTPSARSGPGVGRIVGIGAAVAALLIFTLWGLVWLTIGVPSMSKAYGPAAEIGCMTNLQGLASALQSYASEHDGRFPNAQTWREDVKPYLPEGELPTCGISDLGPNSYEFNPELSECSAWDSGDPSSIPLVYDAGFMGNGQGPHRGGFHVAFADGSVVWLPGGGETESGFDDSFS